MNPVNLTELSPGSAGIIPARTSFPVMAMGPTVIMAPIAIPQLALDHRIATVSNNPHYDVIVLGAGAAGLMCALTAGQRGKRVLVLEKANKVGKKILMSGGGRCNFSNYYVEPHNFLSSNPHFCKSALTRYTQWDFIGLVEKHGIAYEERKHGQLFCLNTAKDILTMLLAECGTAAVEIRTNSQLEDLSPPTDVQRHYRLQTASSKDSKADKTELSCEALVIATGALSIPTLGGSGVGYDIASDFNLPLIARRAGLVPMMFSDNTKALCETLAGIAVDVEVSCNDQSFRENLLFTHRGISGPAILQISNYWSPGEVIDINLMPEQYAEEWLIEAKGSNGKQLLRNLLNRELPRALVNELEAQWWPTLADTPVAGFSDKQLRRIGEQLNNWQLKPSASEGYRTAEVTLGGVDTASISSRTMECKSQPGLYFVGEVLDVTGHLGGFNFQWAWSSGFSAGIAIASDEAKSP
ncbi:MAG: NAD(P)/FAD-dependent oxidoreductase [Halioglobus sp.]